MIRVSHVSNGDNWKAAGRVTPAAMRGWASMASSSGQLSLGSLLTTAPPGGGASRVTREQAANLVGSRLSDVFVAGKGASRAGLPLEFPLWDLAGKRAGEPVYALAAATVEVTPATPFRVRCYDTSLYFDDLHLETEQEAAALIAAEAREGYARGHRAFKIKVGRGARHMELAAGLRRDIAVVRAVREAVGEHATLMMDANNGYNLNLAKQLLQTTAEAGVFWLEEAFHEDDVLYRDLQAWLRAEGLSTLIADGEGLASPRLPEMARQRLVNVVQYDIFSYGFTRWLELGARLDRWGARTAPHHYGGHYGNYASGHLASAISAALRLSSGMKQPRRASTAPPTSSATAG